MGTKQISEKPRLVETEDGLSLVSGDLKLFGDYHKLLPRIKGNKVNSELIVKAVRIRGLDSVSVFDATAGLGEDSFLLAAAGFDVTLCEYNEEIYSLLLDTVKRAKEDADLNEAAERMKVVRGNSVDVMKEIYLNSSDASIKVPDVVLLDPMFPAKTKNSLTNKKLQLFQMLEFPCANEEELFEAALSIKPKKVVVKRPLRGPFLADKKPGYSISGKTVRYDCYVLSTE